VLPRKKKKFSHKGAAPTGVYVFESCGTHMESPPKHTFKMMFKKGKRTVHETRKGASDHGVNAGEHRRRREQKKGRQANEIRPD